MLVSTKGRYALRVMTDLAQNENEGYISLKSIADRQGISLKYLECIVALLHKGKLLKSSRGKVGGYALSRPAREISVYDVIELTETSLEPVSCMEGGSTPCRESEDCILLPMWQNLEKMIAEYLSGITIEELARGGVKCWEETDA